MLPDKRTASFLPSANTGAVDEARRIEVRPRGTGSRSEETNESEENLLHFSCPACLHMMAAAKLTGIVQCPSCNASVMPPQVVNVGVSTPGKTSLPPPKKSGAHSLKR